jgi:hypothetical protein
MPIRVTRDAAMINAQSPIASGLVRTARIEVFTATATPTLRSRSKGNDTTLMLSISSISTIFVLWERTQSTSRYGRTVHLIIAVSVAPDVTEFDGGPMTVLGQYR